MGKILYLAIKAALNAAATKFTGCGAEAIAHIDLYKGQYQLPEEYDGFNVPAVFVEWSILWDEKGSGTQKGEAIIRLHVVTDNSYDTYGSEEEQGLADMLIYDLIHFHTQNLEGENFTKLRRISEDPDIQPTNQHVHIISYKCTVSDNLTSIQNKFNEVVVTDVEVDSGQQKYIVD